MGVVGDPYVEVEAFKASVSIPDNADDGDVTVALLAASRAVEQCAHRGPSRSTFWKDAGATTRLYTARSPFLVVIDDATTVTAVTATGAGLAAGAYFAEPGNAVVDGRPFTRIRSKYGRFSCEPLQVGVTGIYGWPAMPAEVGQLVTIIASKLLKRTREAPWGVVTTGGLDGSAIRLAQTDPDLRFLLKGLTRPLVY